MGLPATPSSLTPLSKASFAACLALRLPGPLQISATSQPCAALPSFPAFPSLLHLSLLGICVHGLAFTVIPSKEPEGFLHNQVYQLGVISSSSVIQHLLPAFSGAKYLYFSFILKCLAPDPWFARKLTSRHWGNDNNNSTVSGLLLLEAHMHSIRVISLTSQQLCKSRE